MKNRKMLLQVLLSIALVFSLILSASAAGASATVHRPDDRPRIHLAADSSSVFSVMTLNTPQGPVTPMVAAGSRHTVGLKSDGTVVAVGDSDDGQCDVGGWTDIVQVAAGYFHTVGLKADGTVVAVGSHGSGQCDVGGWTDITQVTAGWMHTVGLKADGAVVAAGSYEQCDVGGWTDIVQVAAGGTHTVGLKADGTLVAVGRNLEGQCNVGGWMDITQVAAGIGHTVGLKSDGTLVAVGDSGSGRCDVGGWTDIVQVAAGGYHTVGLKTDGTLVAVGSTGSGRCDVGGWTDITQVAAGSRHTVGLKSDGTVVAVGSNGDGQCNVGGWNLGLVVPSSQRILTISSTAGGSVTTPGERSFTYDTGTVVDLVAEPEASHRFVNWTGDVGTIADVNAAQTTITIEGYYAITANFELEEGLCSLTISSTAGGSVTTPGEGTFYYDADAVADLIADSSEHYHFVNWTGNVDTIANVTAAATNITMDDNYSITANFVSVEAGDVGVKVGDWIKIKYTISGWPADQPCPEWLKLEFLSVEGTTANVQATLHMSDGTEQSDTMPVDVAGGGGEAFGLSGFVIPPNLTTGDSVYMTGFGDVAIEGETTRTYAGASRTVVYASFSQSVPYQDEVQLTYYWDKRTGVMVESSTTYADITATAKATETNMWEATTVGMPWWPWIIVAVVAVGLGIFFVHRRRKTA